MAESNPIADDLSCYAIGSTRELAMEFLADAIGTLRRRDESQYDDAIEKLDAVAYHLQNHKSE